MLFQIGKIIVEKKIIKIKKSSRSGPSKTIFKSVCKISDESVHWFLRNVAHRRRKKSFFGKHV